MNQIGKTISGIALWASLGVSAFGHAPAIQTQTPEQTPRQAPAQNVAPSKTTRILVYFPTREETKPSRELDSNSAIRILLKERLRESGKFEVVSYFVSDPTIQAALRDHTLSSSDVMEPLSPDTLKRLATLLNTPRLVIASAHREEEMMVTDVQIMERIGPMMWRTNSVNQVKTPTSLEQELDNGKVVRRKLRPVEVATLAADSIAVQLGLASTLRPGSIGDAPRPNRKEIKPKKKNQKQPDPLQPTPDGGITDIVPSPEPPDKPTRAVTKPEPKKEPTENVPDKKSEKAITKPPRVPTKKSDPKNETVLPTRVNGGFADFTTDGAGGRVDEQKTQAEAQPSPNNSARFDTETSIIRFRQSGDLANVIQSLRRAINDKPKEVGLRRQLVLAYKERQMLDAALGEASRAIQIMPEESTLYRLKGDILAAKGDTVGATAAYNEAIAKGGSSDIASQVALADALLADNRVEEAAKSYEAALKADPKNPLPLRRLARVSAAQALTDPTQYAASLDYLKRARDLTPTSETEGYLDDYVALLHLIESRLKSALGEAQANLQAQRTGKLTTSDLKRSLADLKDRATALNDYLDKLLPGAGQNLTHAHYQASASMLLQAVSLYRDYLNTNDPTAESAVRGAIVDGFRELNDASKRLGTTGKEANAP